MMGHQADPAHCYKFHIYRQIHSTQYFTILFWDWGRQGIARIDSQRYNKNLYCEKTGQVSKAFHRTEGKRTVVFISTDVKVIVACFCQGA
jgi:hypothetical protein